MDKKFTSILPSNRKREGTNDILVSDKCGLLESTVIKVNSKKLNFECDCQRSSRRNSSHKEIVYLAHSRYWGKVERIKKAAWWIKAAVKIKVWESSRWNERKIEIVQDKIKAAWKSPRERRKIKK